MCEPTSHCTTYLFTLTHVVNTLHVQRERERKTQLHMHCYEYFTQCGSSPDGEELPVNPYRVSDGTYRVILRIMKAGCHPVAIAQVVEH